MDIRGVEEMNRKAHESEYMSSDIWKRNVPPVTDFKRGSAYNQFGMWVMWIYKLKDGEGKALMDKLRSQSGDRVQSNNQTSQGSGGNQSQGGQQPQSGVNRSQTVEKSGNTTTTTTKTSADNTTKAGAQAVNDFKANRETRLNRHRITIK